MIDQQQQQEVPEQNLLQQFLQTLNNNTGSGENSDSTNPSNQEEQLKNFLAESGKKSSNQAVKNLLENYGFELVMQFNEYHQRKKEEEERRRKAEEIVAEANNANVTASTHNSSSLTAIRLNDTYRTIKFKG